MLFKDRVNSGQTQADTMWVESIRTCGYSGGDRIVWIITCGVCRADVVGIIQGADKWVAHSHRAQFPVQSGIGDRDERDTSA